MSLYERTKRFKEVSDVAVKRVAFELQELRKLGQEEKHKMSLPNIVDLANHLWQSTLFAGAVWLITLFLQENRAAVRHALWFAASAKFLIPFSLLAHLGGQFQWPAASVSPTRVSVLIGAIGQPFGASGAAIPAGVTSSAATMSSVTVILLVLWAMGFVANILWWAIRWRQLRRAMCEATAVNLNLPIRTLVCRGWFEPGVFGIFRPVLLLPQGIMERLSAGQLHAVLLHEICHVRRQDNLTAAIHMSVEALFWFHPLVWLIKFQLLDEQERACDEEVLLQCGDPQVYAESILKICECYLTLPSMCVSGIRSSNLRKRIGDIMKNRVARKLSLSRATLLTVAGAAALGGPILLGVRAGGAQSGITARESSGTAQLPVSQSASTRIPIAPQGGLRGNGGTSNVTRGYRIGDIRVEGVTAFTTEMIRSALALVSGEVYDESQLRSGFENLHQLYGSRGYVNCVPEPAIDVDEQRKVVNLTIRIDEGAQYRVNRISFTGNTTTPDDVLRREIAVKEGEVFNSSLWELSRLRLNQLGLFEEIEIEDTMVVPSQKEPKLDVILRVTETRR